MAEEKQQGNPNKSDLTLIFLSSTLKHWYFVDIFLYLRPKLRMTGIGWNTKNSKFWLVYGQAYINNKLKSFL